jgi:hypothetical protein
MFAPGRSSPQPLARQVSAGVTPVERPHTRSTKTSRLPGPVLALVALVGLSLVAGPGWTCSCTDSPPTEIAFARADAVLEGRVTDVDQGYLRLAWCLVRGSLGAYPEDSEEACDIRMTLAVSHCWKGPGSRTVRIVTGRGGGDCGCPLEVGKSYLLFLREARPGVFYLNICMKHPLLEEASADRAVLEQLVQNRPLS